MAAAPGIAATATGTGGAAEYVWDSMGWGTSRVAPPARPVPVLPRPWQTLCLMLIARARRGSLLPSSASSFLDELVGRGGTKTYEDAYAAMIQRSVRLCPARSAQPCLRPASRP